MKTIGYAVVGTGYFGAELARIMKEQEGSRRQARYVQPFRNLAAQFEKRRNLATASRRHY